MNRQEKTQIIDELVTKFKDNSVFYVTDASGLTVAEVNRLRRMCFEKGVEYKVVKNTLIKKALDQLEADYTSFDDEVLAGFSGLMFTPESGNLPAKVIKEYRKKDAKGNRPLLKGASIDTDLFIGEQQLDSLSTLKSKVELLGEIITLLQSPAKNVISALQSGESKLAGIVKTLSEKEG
ncbi:MAG: 50S ribosomal protein L10 [Bacteroidota bacterium]